MSQENFDKLLKEYFTLESKVYGYAITAIQDFTQLYDHIMALPDVEHMQETRLLGSVICRHITAYCTNNDNDAMAGITNSKILLLSLSQFKSCTDLVRELNELYHVLPPRLAHSDSQKKLQLKAACGKDLRQHGSLREQDLPSAVHVSNSNGGRRCSFCRSGWIEI